MLYEAGREHGWAYMAPHRANPSGEDWTVATRTVPRGEHRKCPRSERTAIGVELRDQQRGWMRTGYAADGVSPVEDRSRWPRRRRGELRHAEQRRAANS